MNKIVFFSIPAYGHTNPTIEVVRELSKRGSEVWYYSFNEFKEKIEDAGAKFISCDEYIPKLKPGDEKKIGKDFPALIEMIADTTIALDEKVCSELKEFNPDCIVADSMCFWGKLFAEKLNILYVCSTTTFAFNQYSAKMIKRSFSEIVRMIMGMRHINNKINLLRKNGYDVKDFISIIGNSNDTNTIVYTSKEFQPMVETFSSRYHFIGPSVSNIKVKDQKRIRPSIYISLGTVNNKNIKFYKNCIKALESCNVDVIMSVGKETKICELGNIPDNFKVENSSKQIIVLQNTDVFLTHCGMNSVNESLYYGIPMVLFPQQSEQAMVASRVAELGAGIMLKSDNPEYIKDSIINVINNENYKKNAEKLSQSFKDAGGPAKGAEVIFNLINDMKANH